MSNLFPKHRKNKNTGEIGLSIVNYIIVQEFNWIFRATHQEHDYGIDGYIDIVSDENVTGRSIAVQIKTGSSFFKSETIDGFLYRGEMKHINYLMNHPTPVLVIICEPETKEVYWELFDVNKMIPVKNAWNMVISNENILSVESKSALLKIAGEAEDFTDKLDFIWKLNNDIKHEFDYILLSIDKKEIESQSMNSVIMFLEKITSTKEFIRNVQGKVDLVITGYDHDSRELYEIPEVSSWLIKFQNVFKYLFFFLSTKSKSAGLALCAASSALEKLNKDVAPKVFVKFNKEKLSLFLDSNFINLNEITDFVKLPLSENKRISEEVLSYFHKGTSKNLLIFINFRYANIQSNYEFI